MDSEEEKKYAQRAGEVLAEIFNDNQQRLKPPEEAAKELLESEKDINKIESQFNLNSIEILYKYLREKYPVETQNQKLVSLIGELKTLSSKNDNISTSKAKLIYLQIINIFRTIEAEIVKKHPEYTKKF